MSCARCAMDARAESLIEDLETGASETFVLTKNGLRADPVAR